MFTGIIEELGEIVALQNGNHSCVLTIKANKIFEDLKIGDSVATNGVCLTVTSIQKNQFTVDVMHETLLRSSLGGLSIGSIVNLERAMPTNGRFGGHIVSGHIDGIGTIKKIKKDGCAIWFTIETKETIMRYIVEKGSIAVDGISLTVAKGDRTQFSVSVIPHTIQETVLKQKVVGDIVNLENDIIGKYIDAFTSPRKNEIKESNITRDFLDKYGF